MPKDCGYIAVLAMYTITKTYEHYAISPVVRTPKTDVKKDIHFMSTPVNQAFGIF